jgi:predicted acyltransferase
VDVLEWRRFTKPFIVYGLNALAMFVLSGIIARLLSVIRVGDESLRSVLWRNMFEPLAPAPEASLAFALANVGVCWLAAWWMYRRNWIVRA